MRKEVISDSQGISLLVIFLGGTTSLLTLGIAAKQDFWLAILLAIGCAVPVYLVFARLYQMFPGKNLFDIAEFCFGKFIGRLVILAFTLFCFDEGMEVLVNWGQFMNSTALLETPRIFLHISMVLLCIWVVKAGIEVLGRWAQAMQWFFWSLIILSELLLISAMNVNNLLPAFTQGVKPVLKGAVFTYAFPFGEAFAFTIAFAKFRTPATAYKVYLKGLLFGAIIVCLISATNVLVLGPDDAAMYFHPTYFTLRRISLGNLFQRIEVLVSVVYIIGTFVKVAIYLFNVSIGLAHIFGYDDYRFIVFPAGLLMINISSFFLKDIMQYWEYAANVWIYYALPFEVLFPILIWIAGIIKQKTNPTSTL